MYLKANKHKLIRFLVWQGIYIASVIIYSLSFKAGGSIQETFWNFWYLLNYLPLIVALCCFASSLKPSKKLNTLTMLGVALLYYLAHTAAFFLTASARFDKWFYIGLGIFASASIIIAAWGILLFAIHDTTEKGKKPYKFDSTLFKPQNYAKDKIKNLWALIIGFSVIVLTVIMILVIEVAEDNINLVYVIIASVIAFIALVLNTVKSKYHLGKFKVSVLLYENFTLLLAYAIYVTAKFLPTFSIMIKNTVQEQVLLSFALGTVVGMLQIFSNVFFVLCLVPTVLSLLQIYEVYKTYYKIK